MIGSILKMNWQKGLHLKTLQHFYVKIQQLYLKKSVLIGFQIGITKVLFITQRTFAFIVTIVKRPMPVEKSFSVALNVPHELKRDFYATMCKNENWSVRTLRKRKKQCYMNGLLYLSYRKRR